MSPLVIDSFKFFKQYWRFIVLFVAPIAIVEHLAFRSLIDLGAIEAAATEDAVAQAIVGQFPTLAIIEFVFKPLLEGVVIAATLTAVFSGAMVSSVVLKRLLAVAPHLLMAYALRTVIVVAGLLLFIVPGVYLYLRLIVMPVLVVDRSLNAISALRQSWQMTAPAQGQIFTGVVQLVLWVFFPLFFIGQLVPSGDMLIVWAPVTAVVISIFDIYKCRLYSELKGS